MKLLCALVLTVVASLGQQTVNGPLMILPTPDVTIEGTTTANSATTITGVGTLFVTRVEVGDEIALSSAPTVFSIVNNVASDTSLTVATAIGNGASQKITLRKAIVRTKSASGIIAPLLTGSGVVFGVLSIVPPGTTGQVIINNAGAYGAAPTGITSNGTSCTITAIVKGIITGATCTP
jgi:hypothetical protein